MSEEYIALIIDTETTGLKNPVLVEYGESVCALNDEIRLHAMPIKVKRYNPLIPIEFGAMATHGITNEDIKHEPPVTDFAFNSDVEYLIGHNIDYDWKVVGIPYIKRICTLALARKIWLDTSHNLLALMYMLYPDKAPKWHKSAHGVETDIEMTIHLLWKIIDHLKVTSFEDLYRKSEQARVPKSMPFGKYKDTPISELPTDYISWCFKNLEDLDPYLRMAFEKRINQ